MFKGFKKRRLAVALGACMMAPSAAVHALGMGEVEVHSALNEPLKAQIKLVSVSAAELSALQVALAPSDAFAKMGIERTSALRDLRFEVVTQGAGSPYIRIISDAPMREPFLDFILMANWSNGQLMREYTLLLDPPVFDKSEAAAPVMAAKTEASAIARGEKSEAATASPVAPVMSAPVRSATAKDFGPTSRTDTLWSVAREMRQDNSVSVPQMMMAIIKANPEAFVDGNANNLKAGQILRSPSMDVIKELTNSQAVAEINRQYQEWQAGGSKSPAQGRRQEVATAPAQPAEAVAPAKAAAAPAVAAPAEGGARVKLLSTEEAKQQGGSGSSQQGKGSVTEQLALALETAEATKQENAELKTRLMDLERQLQAVQRLLTLKGDTLGALQAGVGEQGLAADKEKAGEVVPPVAAVAPEAVPATVPAQKSAPAPEAKPKSATPVAQTESAQPSLLEGVMADPVLLGASVGGPLLILLAAMVIRRRRQQAELREMEGLGSIVLPGEDDELAKAVAAGAGAATAVKSTGVEENFGDMIDETVANDFGAAAGINAIHAEENEIDPIAEADVYLAYRRYEQAEVLLKEAIRQDGSRNELKLKLLEIYFTTKDRESFEAQAEALYAAIGGHEDELWSQVVEMGREIAPEHPLFAEAGGVTTAPQHTSGAAVAAGLAASAGVAAAAVADDFSFENTPVAADFGDEFSFDLSDEELASSLDISSLDDNLLEGGGGPFNLSAGHEDNSGSQLSSLDDMDIPAGEGLEELTPMLDDEFSLEKDLAHGDDLLDLDGDLASIDSDEMDLGALDGLDAGDALTDAAFNLDDGFGNDDLLEGLGTDFDELTVSATDLDHLDLDEVGESDVLGKGDLAAAFTDGAESDKWTIAPAISSFTSRDVKGEMDDGYVPATNAPSAAVDERDLSHLNLDDADLDLGGEEELDGIFTGSADILGTKLDLARAYIDMGDQNGARSILDEVVKEGDDSHRQEAEQLMRQIS